MDGILSDLIGPLRTFVRRGFTHEGCHFVEIHVMHNFCQNSRRNHVVVVVDKFGVKLGGDHNSYLVNKTGLFMEKGNVMELLWKNNATIKKPLQT